MNLPIFKSAPITALVETLLYAVLAIAFSIFRFVFQDNSFSNYFSDKSIIIFIFVFSIIFISILITIKIGGTSIKETLSNKIDTPKKQYEIPTTMFVGGILGFVTYLILSVF